MEYKICKYCKKEYIKHDYITLGYTIDMDLCDKCRDIYFVLDDQQSMNGMSSVLAYDYTKHKLGNPILFTGSQQETNLYMKKQNWKTIGIMESNKSKWELIHDSETNTMDLLYVPEEDYSEKDVRIKMSYDEFEDLINLFRKIH